MVKQLPPDGNLSLVLDCEVLDAQSLTHTGSKYKKGQSLGRTNRKPEAQACSGYKVCRSRSLGSQKLLQKEAPCTSPAGLWKHWEL